MSRGEDEARCYQALREVRWPEGVSCPMCGGTHVTNHSRPAGTPRRRYLCLGCRRTFTDLTRTPFARTNLPLATWAAALRLVGAGHSTAELARALGVTWDTASRLERLVRAALASPGLVRRFRSALEEGGHG